MKIHYLIYKITCLLNNKIYIGKHKTVNLDDKYFGSGLELNKDIQKFGKEHFIFEVLIDLNNENEMNELERLVVNEDFIKRNDVYNLCIGGDGGNIAKVNNAYTGKQRSIDLKKFYKNLSKEERENRNNKQKLGYQRLKENTAKFKLYCQHISETNSKKHGKETNSFETIWMHNKNLKLNKRIKKSNQQAINSMLSNGWSFGRLKYQYKNEQSRLNAIKNLKANGTKGLIWITNGIKNKLIKNTLQLPNGWKKGRFIKKNNVIFYVL